LRRALLWLDRKAGVFFRCFVSLIRKKPEPKVEKKDPNVYPLW